MPPPPFNATYSTTTLSQSFIVFIGFYQKQYFFLFSFLTNYVGFLFYYFSKKLYFYKRFENLSTKLDEESKSFLKRKL